MGVRDVRAASRATEAERDAGVNDVRIVQRARVRLRSPPPSLHMLAPAAQPTLDKKTPLALRACCSGTTCQPKATCTGAGRTLAREPDL